MRYRAFAFLSIILASLLVVPAVNIFQAKNYKSIEWKKSFLFNMDFASRFAARVLYPWGISTKPGNVIIGQDGWFFLGDDFRSTLSGARRPPGAEDKERAKLIGTAAAAWDTYFANKGVQLFRVMVGPDKGSVYPEYMPRWARPVSPNATDALFAETGNVLYVDLRAPLLEAKKRQETDLYLKTDSHWNNLGAAMGFRAFAQKVGEAAPELRWPDESVYRTKSTQMISGGDSANLLRISEYLSDTRLAIHAEDLPLETIHLDFDTKKVLHTGGHLRMAPPGTPVLVQSIKALNHKKVLWLRDSFGDSMALLMEATFSDVLQLHWHDAIKPDGRLVQLVESWKPDYVFFTVVEREARDGWFTVPPPVLGAHERALKSDRSR